MILNGVKITEDDYYRILAAMGATSVLFRNAAQLKRAEQFDLTAIKVIKMFRGKPVERDPRKRKAKVLRSKLRRKPKPPKRRTKP